MFISLTGMSSFSDPGLHRRPAGGASDGGGGGVIYTTVNGVQRPVLVDFYNLTEKIEALESRFPGLPSRISQPGPISIGYDRDDQQTFDADPAFSLALRITQNWNTSSALMFGHFFSTILRNPQGHWSFTDQPLTVPAFFRPPLLPRNSEIFTAAYYKQDQDVYTIQLFRPLWNDLSLMNQVALIIHETFRAHQIALSLDFSDEFLQKGTVMMLMCKPTEDRAKFLRMVMSNQGWFAENFLGFDKLTKDCI